MIVEGAEYGLEGTKCFGGGSYCKFRIDHFHQNNGKVEVNSDKGLPYIQRMEPMDG